MPLSQKDFLAILGQPDQPTFRPIQPDNTTPLDPRTQKLRAEFGAAQPAPPEQTANLRSMIDALDERRKAAMGVPMRSGDAPVTLPSGEQLQAIPKPEGMTPRDVGIGVAGMMVDPAIQAGESAQKLYQGEGDWKENLGGALGHGAEFLAGVVPAGRAAGVAEKVVPRVAKAVEEAAPLVGNALKGVAEKMPRWTFSESGIPQFPDKAAKDAFARKAAKSVKQGADEGETPLDMSLQEGLPSAGQFPLTRYLPKKGTSDRMKDALANEDVKEGIRDSIREGMKIGAHRWYNTEPIRQAFISQLGENQGAAQFRRYMDLVGATSPRSSAPENVRNASYYYHLLEQGQDIPKKGGPQAPYPYGSFGQQLHKGNIAGLISRDWQYDPMKNPKPYSFVENLSGNFEPGTIDTHAFRNIGMRTRDPRFLANQVSEVLEKGKQPSNWQSMFGEIETKKNGKTIVTYRPRQLHDEGRISMDDLMDKPAWWDAQPNKREYAAAENLYKEIAKEFGLTTAEAQAAAWAGAGTLTGLGSPATKTFTELFNDRVAHTARMRGEHPSDTLRYFISGQKPLLQLGAGAAGTAALGAAATRGRESNPAGGGT